MSIQHRRSFGALIFSAAVMVSPIHASAEEPVTVRVSSDFPIIGNVTIRIFQSLENFNRGVALAGTAIVMNAESTDVVFPDIPDGTCIVSIHHDGNSDGKMNSNAFGIPTESSLFYHPDNPAGAEGPRNAPFELGPGNRTLIANLGNPPADPRAWGVGIMLLLSSNPYRGGDTVARTLPMLTHVGERFFIIGPRAGYNVVKKPWLSMNLLADVKFVGDAFEDGDFLAGMEKRRDTVMAGLDASMRLPARLRLETSALTDVLDRHNGQEVSLSLNRNIRGKRWAITPGAGLVWRTSSFNNYYFGVRENEANAERPAYHAGDEFDPFVRIFYRQELSSNWSLLVSGRLEFLGPEIRDSPIVDKRMVTGAFAGMNFAF